MTNPMNMLPNDHHPGPRCSCAECLHALTNPMSIAGLKAAIERVIEYRNAPLEVQLRNGIGFTAAERDAWKAAYLWRIGFTERWRNEDVLVRERDHETWKSEEKYGTDLIAEVLNK